MQLDEGVGKLMPWGGVYYLHSHCTRVNRLVLLLKLNLIRFCINTCHTLLTNPQNYSSPKFLKFLLFLFTWYFANATSVLPFQLTTLFIYAPSHFRIKVSLRSFLHAS